MQDIHSELAVQQRIDFSVVSGNKFGQDLLQRVANTTMNHEIVPKSIDRLRRAQNVSARRKTVNMQNMTNFQRIISIHIICKICEICRICNICKISHTICCICTICHIC